MLTHDEFDCTGRLVRDWHHPVILTHTKPDGDAIGSAVATSRLLAQVGNAEPRVLLFDEAPDRYRFLLPFEPGAGWLRGKRPPETDDCDGIVLVDTCSLAQLEPAATWLHEAEQPILAVDHHATRDAIADHLLVDESAAATCLIILEWALRLDWTIDEVTAAALFAGMATDTGWFRHSNTDARLLRAAGELVARGIEPYRFYDRIYQQESRGRFRLRQAAFGRLELLAGDQLAVICLPGAAFRDCGAVMADTEDLVNEPLRMASVLVSILLVEQEKGVIRVGLRSREPLDDSFADIDVSAIAQSLGGGGHRRAAGVRVHGDLDHARATVVDRVMPLLGGLETSDPAGGQ